MTYHGKILGFLALAYAINHQNETSNQDQRPSLNKKTKNKPKKK